MGGRSGGTWRTRSDSAEHTLGSTENIINMVIFFYHIFTYLTLIGSLSFFAEHFSGSRIFSPTKIFPTSTSFKSLRYMV